VSSIPAGIVALPFAEAWKAYPLFLQKRLYREGLKNRKTGKEASSNFRSGASGRALEHAGSEDEQFEEKPTPPGTDSSITSGIKQIDASEPFFIYVPPDVTADLAMDLIDHPALILALGARAKTRVSVTGSAENVRIDVSLDHGAQLEWCDSTREGSLELGFYAELKRESALKLLFQTTGFAAHTARIKVALLEEGAEAIIEGLSELDGTSVVSWDTHLLHKAPHTRSKQLFKTVLRGHAQSSFRGKIYVEPIALKTDAYQRAAHLVLSPNASVKADPNLEICADDVKASHGATVSDIDPEALLYLRSRGLSLAAAKELLVEAFCKELR
jgi:Fe-S cluster assembly protein SufD